jgi:hypothetical protein
MRRGTRRPTFELTRTTAERRSAVQLLHHREKTPFEWHEPSPFAPLIAMLIVFAFIALVILAISAPGH